MYQDRVRYCVPVSTMYSDLVQSNIVRLGFCVSNAFITFGLNAAFPKYGVGRSGLEEEVCQRDPSLLGKSPNDFCWIFYQAC